VGRQRYFETAFTENACCCSIQSLLFSRPVIKKNIKLNEADRGGRAVSAAA
jgi:hypothetical protein